MPRGMKRLAAALLAFVWGAQAALAGAPKVVASIPPLHALAAAVMKGIGKPVLLIRDGSSVHHHALKPSDARALEAADVVVLTSYGLEHFLQGRLRTLAPYAQIVQAGKLKGIRLLPRRALNPPGSGASPGAGEDHNGINWHIWLDPENAKVIALRLAEILTRRDGEHGALYAANAANLAKALDAQTQAIGTLLAPVRERPFIVAHDATRYFEARFGLHALASIEPAGGSEPGLGRLMALVKLARAHPGICVFMTPDAPGKWGRLLAREGKARIMTIDPLGLTLTPGPGLYPQLLRNLGEAFAHCLRHYSHKK